MGEGELECEEGGEVADGLASAGVEEYPDEQDRPVSDHDETDTDHRQEFQDLVEWCARSDSNTRPSGS